MSPWWICCFLTCCAAACAAEAPPAAWPWLNRSLSVEERTALLLAAMSLEEKAAQLWQTNYMGGVNASTGFPGVDGQPLGNASTRLAFMVHQLHLGIGSQYGLPGGADCALPPLRDGDLPRQNVSCTVFWRNALQQYVVSTSRLGIPVDFTEETLHSGAHMGATALLHNRVLSVSPSMAAVPALSFLSVSPSGARSHFSLSSPAAVTALIPSNSNCSQQALSSRAQSSLG